MKKNLIIDYGNTLKKIAVYSNNKELSFKTYSKAPPKTIINYLKNLNIKANAIISSVVDFPEEINEFLKQNYNYFDFNNKTQLPIINKYKTINTLGKDRIACAVAGNNLFLNKNVLIINAGTCITYDFVNKNNEYLGGAISPGIMMRFKALNNFTKKLPLIDLTNNFKLIGNTTENSIKSGVLNGVCGEVDSVIEQYKLQYTNLQVVISGGDFVFLQNNIKNNIFAFKNIVVYGLNIILEYNVKK